MNFVPGLPSFDRSVVTFEFSDASALMSARFRLLLFPPGPPKKNPRFARGSVCALADGVGVALVPLLDAPTTRVTRTSVPIELSGASTFACAWSKPCETPMMPMTSPTPAARPSAVRIVRPRRRRSSLKTYPNWNIRTPDADISGNLSTAQ